MSEVDLLELEYDKAKERRLAAEESLNLALRDEEIAHAEMWAAWERAQEVTG